MAEQKLEQLLSQGRTYLLRIEQSATFVTVDGPEVKGEIQGEVRLVIERAEGGNAGASVPQLGLASPGISGAGGESGRISVRGWGAKGLVSLEAEQGMLKASLEADVLYELIGRKLGYERIEEDVKNPPSEKFRGRLTGTIRPVEQAGDQVALVLSDGQIHLVYQEGGLGLIRSILLPLDRIRLIPLAGATETGLANDPQSNDPCHPSLQVNSRRLRIQPVGFRSSATDANPSGTSATRQFNATNTVWGKCCIQFDVQPIHLITNATLKTSADDVAIANSYTDPNANAIEVFFVDNDLTADGGGVCFSSGSALAKVVISDHNVGNDFLLAHELGHALSLIHPWSPSSGGLWAGDHDSVLEPSGSPVIANPDENTYWNCTHATNPVITTLTGTCCLTHDVPDHYVRDFPEHTGAEAPVPPPGRNFYAMSNLWNRRSNNAGVVTPDGQPEHQRPARFNSDGTPYQNYLFAKVETVVNLPVHDVQVKFFLKHPGSGGGAANFQLLGTVPVSDTLRPSSPQTVSLPWQVPAGTPQHSCTFAVARSPAEPDDDLTSLNFQEVEALVHTKNAWVQRNLDISDYPSAENNNGEPNTVWAAPIVISLPREEGLKALPVVLEVDAEGAKRLLGLAVEVPGKERYEVEPGSRAKFELKSRVKPGQELPLIVSAIIPGDAEVGETFSVHIDPRLGRIPLAGYGFEMRITKPYEFVGQILDIALAAYRDYAEITGSEVADKLARLHRDALAQEWYSPRRFQDWLADYVDLVKMLVDEMTRFELFDTLAVGEAFDRFAQAMSNPQGIAPLSCYRDLVSRLQMVVRSLYMK